MRIVFAMRCPNCGDIALADSVSPLNPWGWGNAGDWQALDGRKLVSGEKVECWKCGSVSLTLGLRET